MNIKVEKKQDPWLLVKVKRGNEWDNAVIKALDPSKYEVGNEYDRVWTDYHSTKEDGRIVYQEKLAPTYIDEDGEVAEMPEMGSMPDTQYIIGFLEALAVSVFEAANIDMNLESIKMVAAARAAKNMERGNGS
jgi:hypothetical protein